MRGRGALGGQGGAGAPLGVLVLSLCFLLTGAQSETKIAIKVNPPKPFERGDVSLIPERASNTTCRWYRGGDALANTILVFYFFPNIQRPGANYTGRETMDSTCSLHITDLAGNYSGTYIFYQDSAVETLKGQVELIVSEKPDDTGGDTGLSGGAIAGIVIGCLAAVILIAGLLYYVCTRTSVGRTERHASNGNVPSAPGHNQGATDSKPRMGDEDIQYSTLAFNASHPPQPAPAAGQASDGATIYSEIRKK